MIEYPSVEAFYNKKPTFFHLGLLKRSAESNQDINFVQTTISLILNGFWR